MKCEETLVTRNKLRMMKSINTFWLSEDCCGVLRSFTKIEMKSVIVAMMVIPTKKALINCVKLPVLVYSIENETVSGGVFSDTFIA